MNADVGDLTATCTLPKNPRHTSRLRADIVSNDSPLPHVSPFRPSSVRIDSGDDLLIVRLLMGAQPTLLMVAAAEARIFDVIGERSFTAGEVADQAHLDPRATRLVLDGLVGLGILSKHEERYSNTPTSLRHLRIDTEHSHAVRLWISGTRQWERLPDILRTGKVPDAGAGDEPWLRDRAETDAFVRAMYDVGWMSAQSVAEAVDLSNVRDMVDLGAGPGHYAIAMLERSPKLRATLVDLPLSLLVARDLVRRHGLADRVQFTACDLFEPNSCIPLQEGFAQLVLISHVVHMDGPEQNAWLVTNAARLLAPGGRLILHDMFLEEDRAHPQLSSLFAVHMLAMTRRGELYPASQISHWLSNAGLRTRVISTSPFLVEGLRPR